MAKVEIKGPIIGDSGTWIYDWLGIAYTSPKKVKNILENAAKTGEEVDVEINSPGGYVSYASEIYEAIRQFTGKIKGHIVGTANSCASFIACAIPYCEIAPTATVFIHNCQSGAEGDYRAMEQEGNALREINIGIANAYTEKTGMSQEELFALMDNNTMLSANRAVELGFADAISEAAQPKNTFDPTLVTNNFNTDIYLGSKQPGFINFSNESLSKIKTAIEGNTAQNNGNTAIKLPVDTTNNAKESEETNMTLEEFLNANPEAKAEYDTQLETVRNDAIAEERARIKALDAMAGKVPDELLTSAKFEKTIDSKELAYQAVMVGQQQAQAYQAAAKEETEGNNTVGTALPTNYTQGAGSTNDEETTAKDKMKEILAKAISKKGRM